MNGNQAQFDSRAAASARLANLRRFFAAEPGNARLRRDVVDTAVAAGEFEYVRELAESRLVDLPGDSEAQFDRATALIGLQDYAAAFEALQPLDATIPGVRFNSGLCLFMLGRYAEARPYFEAGVEAGERSPALLRFLLLTLHHLGEMEKAVELADAHAAIAEHDGPFAGTCAIVYVDVNQPQKAAQLAAAALAANPDSIDGLVAQGIVAAADLKNDVAFASFARVTQLTQDNGRAWLGLGLLATLEGNFPRARELLARATVLMPEHLGSWHARAWAHLFDGDMPGAEEHFDHAIELDRNFAESHGAKAAMLALKGDRPGAELEIEIADRLDRSGATALFARSILTANAKGPEAGREYLLDSVRLLARQLPHKAGSAIQGLVDDLDHRR